MKRNLLLILALFLGIATLQAKPVDVTTAQRLGQNFIQHKAMFAKNTVNDLDLAYTYRAENGMATAYVFNFDGGYVIVAADDCSSPILGYSDQGSFDYETAPDGLRFMLSEISRGIETTVQQGKPVPSNILCRWKNLEAYGVMHPDRGQSVVGPLVQTKWDQGAPYNMYAPGGCPTGCVATAMAQLMKYWEWPVTGTGEHSYYAMGYGEQYANFGATTYDWDNMIESYNTGGTQEQKEAVATLMYHCGVSVDMMYEPDGSGAYSQDVPVAINNYFSYSEHATHIGKSGSYNDWIALLKTNIDQHIPIYYSGQSPDGGHAFICDGYDVDDLFHFNYGWGGSGGGYLLIDGENFEYSGSQAIVYDFIPNFVYDQMPTAPENLSVSIDSDVSRIGHLTWTNPSETMSGEALTSIDKVIVKRNGFVVQEITNVAPGQAMTYDDEVPFFDQFDYTVLAVSGNNYGRTTVTKAVFGPYCDWKVIMTSSSFQGWDGGGITVQNAAGSYIDFLTTTQATATIQTFQMALGNNNLYWTAPNSNISNMSFKIRDAENQIVYQYEGPSSGLEAGLLRTLNNSCGNENTCEAPYNLLATVDPENDRNIILTWNSDHTPEFGYCIYRDGFLFNMAHELRYVDENTEIGGHCYYVTALCNGGETANSNEYCATSGSGCEPPKDLYFNYFNGSKVQLFWSPTDNENVTGYVVYRKTDDTPYKRIKNVGANTTNCKDTSVVPGTTYQYVVNAYYRDIDCSSAYATDLFDADKFFIEVDWSNTPRDLQTLYNEEDTVVSLYWKAAYQATSYDIMRNGAKIGETTETFFEDPDLELGETYCYQVIAHGDGFDTNSNEACVTMPEPPAPPVLPCSAPTNLLCDERPALGFSTAIHVEWQSPEDRVPDSYTLYIYDLIRNDTTILTDLTEMVYESGYSVDGTDIIFQVKAVYPECESDFALSIDGMDFVRFTSLSVNEMANLVKLYPNPTSGQLSIEAEEMTTVSVYDLVGQCVMQMTAKDGQADLDMSQLQNGIYLVKVSTANGSAMQRVVKM
jgi:hypothetical protein